MSSLPNRDALEFQVSDFGPIVDATIELRPLTVFVGPSNTGKSYLAILIYALHRFFGGAWSTRRPLGGVYGMVRPSGTLTEPQAIIDSIDKLARPFLDRRKSPAGGSIVLPSLIADEIRSGFDAGGDALGREIGRCFGIDEASALSRKGRRNIARIVLRRRISDDATPVEHTLTLAAHQTEFRTNIPADTPIQISATNTRELDECVHLIDFLRRLETEKQRDDERNYLVSHLFERLKDIILPHVVGPMHRPAYYLPADRTGVMHAHSVVVSALIGSAPTAGLRPATRTPMLSGVLADFLEQLIEIDLPRPSRKSRRHDYGTSIEEAILGGSVGVDRSATINYPRFTYRPTGWKNDLPLMNASSMVSELAPVVLYLRHMVEPGQVLIVEEPESHLHPAMQVKFTRQLAALVNAGFRVLVTTHSEWLLEELANIVRRSELPGSRKTKQNGNDVALGSDQVGAWLFEPKHRPKGSVVTEIRLDDSGLYPTGFDTVAAALHNDWAEISSRIGDGSK